MSKLDEARQPILLQPGNTVAVIDGNSDWITKVKIWRVTPTLAYYIWPNNGVESKLIRGYIDPEKLVESPRSTGYSGPSYHLWTEADQQRLNRQNLLSRFSRLAQNCKKYGNKTLQSMVDLMEEDPLKGDKP